MKIAHEPEDVCLIPESEDERELLRKVAKALGPAPSDRVIPPAQIDENHCLVIWKF